MKITTLKVSGRFTEHGPDIENAEGFDEEALEDGAGQALLQYDDGRWVLRTSEEAVGRGPEDYSGHGYLEADLAKAVSEARRRLRSAGYEVTFKVNAKDPD